LTKNALNRSRKATDELADLGFDCDNVEEMKLAINGNDREFNSPLSLSSLIEHLGMKEDRVAVELNRNIVPREMWAQTALSDGDRLEVVHFVGGGNSLPNFKIFTDASDRNSRLSSRFRRRP
jgi:thiamine biosynthesis protein ThiS